MASKTSRILRARIVRVRIVRRGGFRIRHTDSAFERSKETFTHGPAGVVDKANGVDEPVEAVQRQGYPNEHIDPLRDQQRCAKQLRPAVP